MPGCQRWRRLPGQAALALTPEGKRLSHQTHYRVRQETLDTWGERVLANLDWLASAPTFEELYDRLDSLRFKRVGLSLAGLSNRARSPVAKSFNRSRQVKVSRTRDCLSARCELSVA